MAIGCEDVSARMMELLYGELAGEDRAAVEAHLGGCASCRAELAAFQGTRAAARRALDADAPPARVHDAILRAAAAAVAAKPQPIEARPAARRPPLWERLRGRWTLPTFATVGAVAVVVLASKVFLEPEKTVELGRQTVASSPSEAPRGQAVAPSPEPAAPAAAEGAAPEEKKLAKGSADREKGAKREVHKHAAAPLHSAAKAASVGAPSPTDRLGAPQAAGKGGGGIGRAHKESSDDALDGLLDEAARNDKSLRAAPTAKPAKREFAAPPPTRAQPTPAPPARTEESNALEEDDAVEASPRRRVSGASVPGNAAGPPPAAHASPKAKKAAAPADDFEDRPTAAEEAPASAPVAQAEKRAEQRKAPAKDLKPTAESPVAQADRLFAERRWAEAARAYRELLRRDPRNADAARWKQRLVAAEAEVVPEAPAASKASPP